MTLKIHDKLCMCDVCKKAYPYKDVEEVAISKTSAGGMVKFICKKGCLNAVMG